LNADVLKNGLERLAAGLREYQESDDAVEGTVGDSLNAG